MKLLFIHDHPFYEEENRVYSGGGLPASVWGNYLDSFDSIKVIGRKTDDIKNKVCLSSGNTKVVFKLIPYYTSALSALLNHKKIKSFLISEMRDIDIVLLRLPSFLGFIAYSAVKKLNKPFFVEQVGNCKEALNYKSLLGKISAPILENINQKIILQVPFVVFVTKKKLQTIYPTNGKTIDIPNVLLPYVLDPDSVNPDRFNNEILKIGLIGTFETIYKGQETLLKAISILPSNIKSKVQVYLVGKGDFNWIEKIAKDLDVADNIKFLGSKKNGEEIFTFLNDLSLYVQPSYTEGMPRALLEAMAMGCPVLGSTAGGISDILDEYQLHEPKDYKNFLLKLKCVI